MRTHNPPPTSKTRRYVVVFVALGIALTLLLVKQKIQPTNPSTGAKQVRVENENTPKTPNGALPSGALNIPGNNTSILQPKEAQGSVGQQTNKDNPNQGGSKSQPQGDTYAPLGCFADQKPTCSIGRTDSLYTVLGQDPDAGLLVGGVVVKPEKIVYKVSLGVYADAQIADGQGKVLSSSGKEYDAGTKTLTLTIGVNSGYYNSLQSDQQHTLLLSQTVRSFLAMFGETPNNFIKVEKAVSSLGSWQPTQ